MTFQEYIESHIPTNEKSSAVYWTNCMEGFKNMLETLDKNGFDKNMDMDTVQIMAFKIYYHGFKSAWWTRYEWFTELDEQITVKEAMLNGLISDDRIVAIEHLIKLKEARLDELTVQENIRMQYRMELNDILKNMLDRIRDAMDRFEKVIDTGGVTNEDK